jgi:hypothetical protein
MNSSAKKNRCEICEGVGLVKNNNMICDNCNGIKCKYYTGNPIDYAPYELCFTCNSTGYTNLTNDEKKSCEKCYGKGYNKKDIIDCELCNESHIMCYCYNFIAPYAECVKCEGSGSIEE